MSFIKGLNDIDNNIKLQKYTGDDLIVNKPEMLTPLDASAPRMRICFLDLETTFTFFSYFLGQIKKTTSTNDQHSGTARRWLQS